MATKFDLATMAALIERQRKVWVTLSTEYLDGSGSIYLQRRELDGWYRVYVQYDYTNHTVFASPSLKCVVAEANRWLAKPASEVTWTTIKVARDATRDRCNAIGVSV